MSASQFSTASPKPFFRWSELRNRYGSGLLNNILQSGWLAPCARSHRLSLYAAASVAAVDARLEAGELPPRRIDRRPDTGEGANRV